MLKSARLAAVVVLMSASALACTAPTSAAPVYCAGKKATIVAGTKSPRIVSGTSHADVIAVTGGIHQVYGGNGNDTMCTTAPGSALFGDNGNDRLVGGNYSDSLDGGSGNDVIAGGGGADRLLGGDGNDLLQGQAGNDSLAGQNGSDTLDGGTGSNVCQYADGDPTEVCPNDLSAPVISGVSAPTDVDVSTQSATVPVEFSVAEEGTGVRLVFFYVELGHGEAYPQQYKSSVPELISPAAEGAAGSGRYSTSVTIPAGASPGSWKLRILVADFAEHETNFYSALTVADANPAAAPQLVAADRLQGSNDRTQTFSLHVTSAQLDLNSITVDLKDPDGFDYPGGTVSTPSTGTLRDGVWTFPVHLPDGATAGTWTVAWVSMQDSMGRPNDLYPSESTLVRDLAWNVS
jgi:hypothetical protein